MANPIGDLFGPSPIRPIQKHMAKAQSCVKLLESFFACAIDQDWAKAEEIQLAISDAEHEADELKRDIRLHLPRSLWLPVARTDLLELLHIQDQLADRAEDIAGLMLGRKMLLPESLIKPIQDYYQINLKTSAQALKVINELDELLETGFGGKESSVVENLVAELDVLEHQSDEHQVTLRAMLFQIEESLPPIQVMFYYKIIDMLGDLSDISQKIGSRLLLLVAH
ncbi:MAG: TIGR00153 family protein [Pseudomonadales bacterium]|nr:TIGR00153 family protein [Pseudomonadales bacterium]